MPSLVRALFLRVFRVPLVLAVVISGRLIGLYVHGIYQLVYAACNEARNLVRSTLHGDRRQRDGIACKT